MDRKQAVTILKRKTTIPGDGYTWEQINEAIDMAIAALSPPNDLLTIEQMREMDGEPVYVVPLNEFYDLGKWCVLGVSPNEDYSCALVPGIDFWVWRFKDYGKDWLAYRRPPEGEEET